MEPGGGISEADSLGQPAVGVEAAKPCHGPGSFIPAWQKIPHASVRLEHQLIGAISFQIYGYEIRAALARGLRFHARGRSAFAAISCAYSSFWVT
jgi:hypothetical protein